MSTKKANPILDKAAKLRDALRKIDEATGNRTAWTADSQQQVSEFFGVSVNTVMNWAKQGMPGQRGTYRLDLIAHWLRSDGPWQRYEKTENDPLLTDGSDSPALEQYRIWKARHAELDYKERCGDLVERGKSRDVLARWAVLIRRMGERLGKRYGPECAAAVNDTLIECVEIIDSFGDSDSDTDSTAA